MALTAYIKRPRWNARTKTLLDRVCVIVEEYNRLRYRMTLRQLYYQLVARDILPNEQKQYARLSRLLTEARMCGVVDWDFIEDRIRVPKFPNEFGGIEDAMETVVSVYRLDRWKDQETYLEVWVEKDALSGVLEPITRYRHVRLLVNRGYSSATAMHDAALRFKSKIDEEKDCKVLYFGDLDPSGEDMVRDVRNRLIEFGCAVEIEKIALTMEQVRQYDPPPNPAKMTDPRASAYIAEHGTQSWELDALPPNVLVDLVSSEIERQIDFKKYNAVIQQEDVDKRKMATFGRRK